MTDKYENDPIAARAVREHMAALVRGRLIELGWTPCDGAGLVYRDYDSICNKTRAFVYTGGDRYNFSLQGQFESEGRNVLCTAGALIDLDATDERVIKETNAFALRAQGHISRSFAVRMLPGEDKVQSSPAPYGPCL